ncbi:MAG: zinc-ribbon domain-containing protein [Oscillibacter sp.]|jgi:vacuolar-type H+-ATPase subunit I/STV1|nr:zinc-ribbon domain-containing protein [Oscillibacter sp.]
MDERLQNILDSVTRAAESIGTSASDAAYTVSRKTAQLLSVGKRNIRLADLRGEVNALLREIGELVYATHTGDPTDSDVLLEKLRDIDELQRQIAELERENRAEDAGPACPRCGAENRRGDRFCRFCGGKL